MRPFADVGTSLIRRWDLDRAQLAALARVQRRPGLGGAAFAPKDVHTRASWRARSTFLQFALLVVLGLVGVAGVLFPSFFLGLTFSYTLIMLLFGAPFFRHCTSVLLDTSENRILLHLPISGRTLLASRLLSLAKYAVFLAFSISLPTAIALAVRFGAVALLVFAISLVLTLLFIVAVTLAVCLFALRHVNPARVREGILWFQTALFFLAPCATALVISADVPFVARARDLFGQSWSYFYPPGWMAGLMDFALMEKTRFNSVLAATAVLVPLAGFVACIALFAGGRFTALLSRLEVVHGSSALTSKRLPRWFARLSGQICVLINGDRQERAVFDLTSKLMEKDSASKRQAFPAIAALLVNAGLIVARFRHGAIPNLNVFLCCYPLLFLAMTGPLIQYSAEWRAAWVYQVLPFEKPGVITSGVTKAYICKRVIPVWLLLLIVSAAVWGTAVALDFLFAIAVIILMCVQRFWSAAPAYSKDPALLAQKGRMAGRLAFIPFAFGLIAVHVVLKTVAGEWGVVGGIVVLGGAVVVAFRKLRLKDSTNGLHRRVVVTQVATGGA